MIAGALARASSRVPLCAALVAATLLLLASLPGAAAAGPTDWTKLRVLNIAHQGGEDEAPSSTMYSLERAMRLGSDMLEIDVHTSADGELMVLHDSTVDRTTDGSGSVYEMTAREIQALDAGHNFVPGEGTEDEGPASDFPFRGVRYGERKPPPSFEPHHFRIPVLDEVISKYPTVPVNIEIKGASDEDVASFLRNAEMLAAYLNDLGRTEGIMVASFNDAALARFHQLAPQIDTAPAIAGVAAYKLADVPPPEGTKAFQVPISFQGVSVTDEEFIDRAHSDGYGVHVWTINDPGEMRMLLGWDADGIMTAEVGRLESVLCAEQAPRPDRPAAFPGRHCSPKASIACDVEAVKLKRKGRRAKVVLERNDSFDSRCAGRVAVKAIGSRARRKAKFDFGWEPPGEGGEGGPGEQRVTVRLGKRLAKKIRKRGKARVMVHPYTAFVDKSRLEVG